MSIRTFWLAGSISLLVLAAVGAVVAQVNSGLWWTPSYWAIWAALTVPLVVGGMGLYALALRRWMK